MPLEPFRPTAFQSALLLLRLCQAWDQEKQKTKLWIREKKKGRYRYPLSGKPELHAETHLLPASPTRGISDRDV